MGRPVCCSSSARGPQHGTTAQHRMACRLRLQHSQNHENPHFFAAALALGQAVCPVSPADSRLARQLTGGRGLCLLGVPVQPLDVGLRFARHPATNSSTKARRHEEGSCRTLSGEAYGISLFTMPGCGANPGGCCGQSWLRRQAGGGFSGRAWCGVRACSRHCSTWAATMIAMACGDLSLEPLTPMGQVMRAM